MRPCLQVLTPALASLSLDHHLHFVSMSFLNLVYFPGYYRQHANLNCPYHPNPLLPLLHPILHRYHPLVHVHLKPTILVDYLRLPPCLAILLQFLPVRLHYLLNRLNVVFNQIKARLGHGKFLPCLLHLILDHN